MKPNNRLVIFAPHPSIFTYMNCDDIEDKAKEIDAVLGYIMETCRIPWPVGSFFKDQVRKRNERLIAHLELTGTINRKWMARINNLKGKLQNSHHFWQNCKNSQFIFQIAKIAKSTKNFSINPLSPIMNPKSNKLLTVHTTHLSTVKH